jgi:uncharacterized protein (DUF1330 family)
MSVYFIVQEAITDPAAMAQYGEKARAASMTGKVIAVDAAQQVIEGDWHGDRTVVIEFPDEAAFRAWYDSPAYQEALKIRLAASDSRSALVKGIGG